MGCSELTVTKEQKQDDIDNFDYVGKSCFFDQRVICSYVVFQLLLF